jgi:hypothetical protein
MEINPWYCSCADIPRPVEFLCLDAVEFDAWRISDKVALGRVPLNHQPMLQPKTLPTLLLVLYNVDVVLFQPF